MTEKIALTLSEIHPSSYVDPNGVVYKKGNLYFRYLSKNSAPFFDSIIENGLLNNLERNFGFVASKRVNIEVEGLPKSLVLEHPQINPMTFCVEWCPSMLQAAALSLIDTSIYLLNHKMMLQDAYPWNFIFTGTRPVNVDVGSIVPFSTNMIWPAYQQFLSFFYRPLVLASESKGDISRRLLFNNIGGG